MEEQNRQDKPLHKEVSSLRQENERLKRRVDDLKRKLVQLVESNILLLQVTTEHVDDYSAAEKDNIAMACVMTMPIAIEDFN